MPLDMKYLEFCQDGSPFYVPSKSATVNPYKVDIPKEWSKHIHGPWTSLVSPNTELPIQGWKIHVTATLDNAQSILNTVCSYCFEHGLTFKYLSSSKALSDQNWKYANRSGSGKFITIYPVGDESFSQSLEGLDELLCEEKGPYILSDRRWKNGPLYYRYGSFLHRFDDAPGMSSLLNPEGELEEDKRLPVYSPPKWAKLPISITAEDDGSTVDLSDFPFEVKSALHFSNGGGVYIARTTTDKYAPIGTEVVLKEARPYAGLDALNTDAIERLRHEAKMMQALKGSPYVPMIYGYLTAWEHEYIVMEKIAGNVLSKEWMLSSPVLKVDPSISQRNKFREWAVSMVRSLNMALQDIHQRDILLSDIHMHNIIDSNGTPKFIDFEFAHEYSADWRGQMGAPGYAPPPGLYGKDADRWALGVTQLQLFYPQATLAGYGSSLKIIALVAETIKAFELPSDIGRIILANTVELYDACGTKKEDPLKLNSVAGQFADMRRRQPSLEKVRNSIATLIIKTAQLDQDKEGPIFPSDIEVYLEDKKNALDGFAYGTSGCVWALHNAKLLPEGPLRDTLLRDLANSESTAPGFFRGRDGIAYLLEQFGYSDLAHQLWTKSLNDLNSVGLWDGYAGLGLAHLDCYGNTDFVQECSLKLIELLGQEKEAKSVGLIYGWSGASILWSQLYRETQDGAYVDLSKAAIRADLQRCRVTQTGTLEYDDKWRTLPYLGVGSCGVGMAINELRLATGEISFAEEDELILKAASYGQYAHSGLAHGLSGILIYLAHRRLCDNSEYVNATIERHAHSLRIHALPYRNEIAFLGNQSLRLSMDYFTGSAGVLAALTAIDDRGSGLPLIGYR